MKIIEAINRVDALMHNTYSQNEKVQWLSELDYDIKQQIIDNHEGGQSVSFTGYNADTPVETVLLVPAPHDIMYLRWLEAQIHYHNGEYDKYNNAIVMFNTAFDSYQKHYTRTHKPLSRGVRFLF